MYEKAVEAERDGIPNEELLQRVHQPYYRGIRVKRILRRSLKGGKSVSIGGVETQEYECDEYEIVDLGFMNGFTLFVMGFLFFPAWWVGSFWPSRKTMTTGYERQWQRNNRIMSVLSFALIVTIGAVLIWQWQTKGALFES